MNEYIFIQKNEVWIIPKTAEQCKEIREQTREKILNKSMLYFAKNGFAGTKISDLARHIGIAQGTIYLYFESKESLFQEIYRFINKEKDIKQVKFLASLPISAKDKINILSESLIKQLEEDADFAAVFALNTQTMFEQEVDSYSAEDAYQSELYKYTAMIITQGQKERTVVPGSAIKLADYYWGVMYLYSLKKLFTTNFEMISEKDLSRILLKG